MKPLHFCFMNSLVLGGNKMIHTLFHRISALQPSCSYKKQKISADMRNQHIRRFSKKNLVEKYQRLSPVQHILCRPDSYIGSISLSDSQSVYLYDQQIGRMFKKEARIVPGLWKIYDELLVNAADNKRRDSKTANIRVSIDRNSGTVSVWNDGRGIPIEIHPTEAVYVPTLIFGVLFTSSNYDDQEIKIVGGRNGFGAKLCNIFSTEFSVETCTASSGLRFFQKWRNNMSDVDAPVIERVGSDAVDYTSVTFRPDFSRFGVSNLDDDTFAMMIRRTVDVAGTLEGVNVYLNGEKLKVSGFNDYINLYPRKGDIVFTAANERWKVGLALSDFGFQQISFVNNINTIKGGSHVAHITSQLVSWLKEKLAKRIGTENAVSAHQIKNKMFVFVNSLIENPSFESQSKDYLTTSVKNFGSVCVIPDAFYKDLVDKSDIVDCLVDEIGLLRTAALNRTKRNQLTDLPKLEDAANAGTANGKDCTLILTEGDSAKALAVAGLAVVGRQNYGVFPIRGKLINVSGLLSEEVMRNAEISSLVRILGLKFGENYDDEKKLNTLRYGRLLIMTDQDPDGAHIKGLIVNFLYTFWPSLIKAGFISFFITPLLKARKGREVLSFYSTSQYKQWMSANPDSAAYTIKYYKGLGTSSAVEAREYFTNIEKHVVRLLHDGECANESVKLAFSKGRADDRKSWICNQSAKKVAQQVDFHAEETSLTTFINKEVLEYSLLDLHRSLPSVVDGFKPSQRKVLFTMFKHFERCEVRVSQLVGAVSQHCGYHHGEESLVDTVVRMAQDFVGSNNMNLLLPLGQFGTRISGGKDAASARYIYTALSPLARAVFPSEDDKLLKLLVEDGSSVEPQWFCPVIPMVLVNGAEGIGTGWASKVLPRCPRKIIDNAQRLVDGKTLKDMEPFFRYFRGGVTRMSPNRYQTSGLHSIECCKNGFRVVVTELPIGVWSSNYKERILQPLVKAGIIKTYDELHTESDVHFVLHIPSERFVSGTKQIDKISKLLKLQSLTSENSMVLHNANGTLKKFESIHDIFMAFFDVRRRLYEARLVQETKTMRTKLAYVANQLRLVNAVISGDLKFENHSRSEIIAHLLEMGFDSQSLFSSKRKDSSTPNFDYLLDMPLARLTSEERQDLQRKYEHLTKQLDIIHQTTWKSLWSHELNVLSSALDKWERRSR